MVVHAVDILLVEDNPGDVLLTQVAFQKAKVVNALHVVNDGESALRFLRAEGEFQGQRRPDLVLLDLNLPGLSGQEVLAQLKADPALRTIPVVVLTSSSDERNVLRSYSNHANAYVTKPVDSPQLVELVSRLDGFWFGVVRLPRGPGG